MQVIELTVSLLLHGHRPVGLEQANHQTIVAMTTSVQQEIQYTSVYLYWDKNN